MFCQAIHALEVRFVSGQPKQQFVQHDPDGLLNSRLVRQFFAGVSKVTISRWRRDPKRHFPEPDLYIGPVPYWKRRTLLNYVEAEAERQRFRTQVKPTGDPPPQATGDAGVP
jgi:hypothetical protein